MTVTQSWGVVSTIRAPSSDILDFAAYHLDLGAARIWIYLDEDAPEARKALRMHPRCRVIVADERYWSRRQKGRPDTHQHRQTFNASHRYARAGEVAWLAHLDVDEFLWPTADLNTQLAALPSDTLSGRVRPIEAMAVEPSDPPPTGQIWCKGCAQNRTDRRAQTNRIYPHWGNVLNGGFMSHVEGKVFVRTARPGVRLRIHNAIRDGTPDPDCIELQACKLVHLHAVDWDHWRARFEYRLRSGAYRPALKAAPLATGEALNMNTVMSRILEQDGEAGLRAFFDDVCTAHPELRAKLEAEGHLHAVTLDLAAKRRAIFDL